MNYEILAWDTTDPHYRTILNTGDKILPPVNPWDVVPSEPVESTGWANFENFENTLSIENTENKKPSDELKEETSEATAATAANLTEKDMASSESIEDGEKNKDYVDSQVIGTGLSVAETNLNDSKSEEQKTISANENANPSELPVDRYLYSV